MMKVIIRISSLCFLFLISSYAFDVRGPTIGTDYALKGQTVNLKCLATNSSIVADVNWAKIGVASNIFQINNNGSSVLPNFPLGYPNPSDYSVTVEHISPTEFWCNMSILTLSQSDLGEYTCWDASGSSPVEGDGLTLEFAELPNTLVISESLNDVTEVIENVPDTLTCTAFGSKPEVSIHWTIDGIGVDEDSSDYFIDGTGYFTTYSNITYTYNRTHHGRLVGCNASNIAGTTNLTTVTLDVLFSAIITNPEENTKFANKGGEAVLKCEAEGNPPPDFTWTKDNTSITGTEDHIDLVVSGPVGFTSYSTLTIDPVDPGRDNGDYICNATNPHGYQILTINLNGTSILEAATDIMVTNATATTLTVTWTEGDDGGRLQTFTVQYRVNEFKNAVWEDSQTVDQPPDTLNNLTSNTKYEIRVRSDNGLGREYSESIEYTTARGALGHGGGLPRWIWLILIIGIFIGIVTIVVILRCKKKFKTKPVEGVKVTNATATTLTVTWTEGDDGGRPQTFTVQYRVDGSNAVWEDSQTVDQPPDTLTDLTPNTAYEIRVRSDKGLRGVESESIVVSTEGLDNNTYAQIQGSKKKKKKKTNTNINTAYSDQPPEVLPPIAIRSELVSPQQLDNETNFENISQEKKPKKNPEGLVYAELDLKGSAARVTKSDKPKPKDGQNTYASIDFNQTALLNQ